MSKRALVFLIACLCLLAAGAALAATGRADSGVAGVRATLSVYDNALLTGNSKAGCAVMTKQAQTQLAKINHATSCSAVIKLTAELLEANAKQAAALRTYASKAHITIHGDTAVVAKLNGSGAGKLTYTHGLWYVS